MLGRPSAPPWAGPAGDPGSWAAIAARVLRTARRFHLPELTLRSRERQLGQHPLARSARSRDEASPDDDHGCDHDFVLDLPQSRDRNSGDDDNPDRNADWDARPPPHQAAGSAGSPSHYAIGDADDSADLDGYQGH